MYVQSKDLNQEVFYQGDLIKSFPFLILDKEIKPSDLGEDGEGKIEIKAKLGLVMVLSQTCDVQRRENIIVCPVYRLQDFSFKKDEVESIKKRKTGYWFYLPKLDGIIEESIADFQTIYYVSRGTLDVYKQNKISTLTDWGRHHLGYALSNYFGRPIESKD
jgi:hypothetical protein